MRDLVSELTHKELHENLKQLVSEEREIMSQVIYKLGEVETRRSYSYLGYTSMYLYAVRELGYSESAALRRIKAARAATKLPKVHEYLASGEVNLSTVNICSEFLTGEKGAVLLEEIRGRSQ